MPLPTSWTEGPSSFGIPASVTDAKEMWLRAQQAADDRTQRIVRKATELLRGEYALGMGCFNFDGLLVTTRLIEFSPWNGDIVGIQAMTDPAASITFDLLVARITAPTVQTSILAAPLTTAPSYRIFDRVIVDETDTEGGANAPDLSTLELTQAGVITTDLFAGDAIYCNFTAVSGTPKIFGLQLKCTLRVAQAILPAP